MTAGRVRRLTLRARLTMVYGGLFLLGGMLLLAITYWLQQDAFQSRTGSTSYVASADTTPSSGVVVDQPDPGTVQVDALYEKFTTDALNDLVTRGAVALGVVAVGAVGAGWLIAGRALRPVQRITATARRVAGNNLGERIAVDGPRDELRELSDTFNSMLERLDEAFERLNHAFDGQREFAANASHELRTPLTLNRALLEVALDAPDVSADVRALATQLLVVNDRHERLIEGMLMLARAENRIIRPEPADLADAARAAIDSITAVANHADVHLTPALKPAPTVGDPILLEQLAHNLIRNAVQYNTAGGIVTVTTGQRDGTTELRVTNTGPVLHATDVPRLFEPFHRHTERRDTGDGAGLGLAIVRAVVRAHHGTVEARPRNGGGLTVRVSLPATVRHADAVRQSAVSPVGT